MGPCPPSLGTGRTVPAAAEGAWNLGRGRLGPPECNRLPFTGGAEPPEPPAATSGYKEGCGGRWERSNSRVKLARAGRVEFSPDGRGIMPALDLP